MKRIAIFLLALLLLLPACGRVVPEPIPETTTAMESTTAEEATTKPLPTTGEAPAETGRYVFYRFEYAPGEIDGNYYVWLPNSMSIEASIIMDMEFAGFDDPNTPPEPPRKAGEFTGVHELAPGGTLEDMAGENYQNSEYTWERLDAGELTGYNGNRIYYQVVTGGELGSYRYHFYIMLDETQVAQLYFWNSVYIPEVDLPRFSEIAASVKL